MYDTWPQALQKGEKKQVLLKGTHRGEFNSVKLKCPTFFISEDGKAALACQFFGNAKSNDAF